MCYGHSTRDVKWPGFTCRCCAAYIRIARIPNDARRHSEQAPLRAEPRGAGYGRLATLAHQACKAYLLDELGLDLSEEKTKITHVEDGFDFLVGHLRRT